MGATRGKRVVKLSGSASDITVMEAFKEFMRKKEAENKAASTLRNYRQSFNYFYEHCGFEESSLAKDIKIANVYSWINSLKKQDVSPASQNHYLRDLRTFLYYLMDKEYIEEPFKVPQVEEQEEQLKLYSDEDLEKLLLKPSNKKDFVEWRTWAIVNWVCATGNRAGTVADVRLGDLNYKNNEISLHHTKNKKAQNIPFSASLQTAIKEYVRMFRTVNPDGVMYKSTDYLFPNISNDKLTYNALRQAFERYCEARGVERANIHGLRHNFAKNFIKTNGNVFKLQQILGHKSVAMTRKYVSLFSEDLKEDFEEHSLLDTMKKSQKRTKKV